MLGGILGPLERAVFHPERLPSGLVFGIALLPSVAVGLWLYRGQAALMLGIAVGIAAGLQLLARILRLPTGVGMLLPALVGVGLVGPGAALQWSVIVAVTAGLLELCRASLVPGARNELGVLAYSLAYLLASDSLDRYYDPGSGRAQAEPITLWLNFFSASGSPVEPMRLYVGNVPGPVFATSLLAVLIGAAWFWYARRLSLVVVAGFLLGALLPIRFLGWNPTFQLESGPLWFAVALILADRERLPEGLAPRPFLGVAAGILVMALRNRGIGVEGAFLTVAGLQLVVSAVEATSWLSRNRVELWLAVRSFRSRGPSQVRLAVARRNVA